MDTDSSDSDESYIVNFSYPMFMQVNEVDAVFLNKQGNRFFKRNLKSLLIDTGSTFSCLNNKGLVMNLRMSKTPMTAVTNGGTMVTDMEGDLPGWFTVYVNEKSMMNILSMRDVTKKFRVTLDTEVEKSINVHVSDERVVKFKEVGNGLYIWNPEDEETKLSNKKISSYSFLTLVEANKRNFTRRELKRADDCRRLFINLGMPGYRKFYKMIETNQIRDCPLTTDDAKRCLHIYGPEIAKLKGCTTR